MSARSLRRRLLFLLLASTGLIWLGTASYSYFDTRHEIGVLLDAHLAQAASLLTAQLGAGSLGDDSEASDEDADDGGASAADRLVPDHRFERQVAFQVWREGRLLLRSATAPRHRLSEQAEGFSDVRHADVGWRVFSHRDAQRELLIQVGERSQLREHLASQMSEHLLHPLLVALPLLGILIWVSVGRGLAPLAAIGRQLDARAPDHLEALDVAAAPREVAPLIATLNALFMRVAATLGNERRFTADAAHELRTPLAALRAQAQVALGAGDEGGRRRAIGQVIAGCDRATHLVEQLLTLARLDPRQGWASWRAIDLQPVVAGVLADLGEVALGKGVNLSLEGRPTVVAGDADLLSVLTRNLADNAIRYTPSGGSVRLSLTPVDGGGELEVADDGPGVAEDQRARLGERFFRVLGSGETGSGLGLSIVRRICELLGAELVFLPGESGERGLRVRVRFAAAPPVR